MKQVAKIISVYSSDVFGVASALFELDGMTVIHDPSGCNSTYTTHDEPRWYGSHSRIFITGLTDTDAVLGRDDKVVQAVCDTAAVQRPRFITLCGSPLPMMMGTDYAALGRLIERQSGIPTLALATDSMRDYVHGAGLAFAAVADRLVPDVSGSRGRHTPRVNVLGTTPLDFSTNGSAAAIADFLQQSGLAVQSRWSLGTSLDEIRTAAQADLNLVVSSTALPAAKVLRRRFGQPYVVGVPWGIMQPHLRAALLYAYTNRQSVIAYASARNCSVARPDVVIIGESVTASSLATAVTAATGLSVRVICPVTVPKPTSPLPPLLGPADVQARDETDLEPLLAGVRYLVADPLYAPICPADTQFVPLPHEAFSGRLYAPQIPNLVTGFDAWLQSWFN